MLNFFKQHKIEFAIFSLAVITRLIFFFVFLYTNEGNLINTIHGQDGYFELSKNLLLGNGFSINPTPPFFEYSYGVPMYPFFMAFLLWITGSYFLTIMVQILLSALIPVIGMHITRLILPSNLMFGHAPLIVGIPLAIAPYQILLSFSFYTETLFIVVFLVFLILFLNFLKTPSARLAVWAGLFLGLATLTKPTVLYLVIIAPVFALWHLRDNLRKDIWLKLGCFISLFFIVLSPWLYRNYRVFNMINLGSQLPFNLYEVLLPSVLAVENQTSFATEQEKLPLKAADIFFNTPKSVSEEALAEISRHPVALIKLSMLNSVTFFTHDGMLTFLQNAGVQQDAYLGKPALLMLLNAPLSFAKVVWPYMRTSLAFVFFARLFWITVTIFFGLGLYKLWRLKLFSPQLLFVTIIVFYFMLTTMINGLAVNARFRMPVEPIIFAVAYAGLLLSNQHLKKKFTTRTG